MYGYDQDPPQIEVIATSEHKARKTHKCHGCGGSIRPGECYRRTFILEDGEPVLFRDHTGRCHLTGWRLEWGEVVGLVRSAEEAAKRFDGYIDADRHRGIRDCLVTQRKLGVDPERVDHWLARLDEIGAFFRGPVTGCRLDVETRKPIPADAEAFAEALREIRAQERDEMRRR